MLIFNRFGDPPLGTFDDKQVFDLSPGSIMRFQAGISTNNPVFNLINETGQPQVLVEYLMSLEDKITKFYGIDRLLDFNSSQQMTATEVEARSKIRNSTLNDLFQSEIDDKYSPLIERSFNLLFRNGFFNDLLVEYEDELFDILNSGEEVYSISYYNQIERDKNNQNNNSLLNIWNSAGLIAQMTQDISVFDGLDADKTVNLMKTLSYTNEIFRSQPDIDRLRQERAEQQMLLAQAQMQSQNNQEV
jgi:hypothetical protein